MSDEVSVFFAISELIPKKHTIFLLMYCPYPSSLRNTSCKCDNITAASLSDFYYIRLLLRQLNNLMLCYHLDNCRSNNMYGISEEATLGDLYYVLLIPVYCSGDVLV